MVVLSEMVLASVEQVGGWPREYVVAAELDDYLTLNAVVRNVPPFPDNHITVQLRDSSDALMNPEAYSGVNLVVEQKWLDRSTEHSIMPRSTTHHIYGPALSSGDHGVGGQVHVGLCYEQLSADVSRSLF